MRVMIRFWRFCEFAIVCLALLLFVRCKSREGDHKFRRPLTIVGKFARDSLIGVWSGNCCLMYTSELKLNSDSTFAFYDWGCTEKRFTQGRWKVTDGDILLSSYDTYKPKHDDLPIGTILLPRIKGKKPHLKKGEAEYSIVGMKDTLVVGPRGRDDTTWVYFDHLPLQLKKDSLCVKSKDLPGPVNFYRTF